MALQADRSRQEPYVPHRTCAGLRLLWCKWMHDDLSWPKHGKYVCRKCGIVFTVPWRLTTPEPPLEQGSRKELQ